ncbi:MAG: tetratricopeptide repeat protein [Cyanobacteria bacterium P01_D01_bin.50]
MNLLNLPFDTSTHFDDNLRDVANSPDEQAINFLNSQLNNNLDVSQKLQIIGLIGVYSRILCDFGTAHIFLSEAIILSQQCDDKKSQLSNQIRLAHLYQWERNYAASDEIFSDAISICDNHPQLKSYLDFAYQHAGKNKFDQGKYIDAEDFFQKALQLRLVKNNQELIESTQLALQTVRQRLLKITSEDTL